MKKYNIFGTFLLRFIGIFVLYVLLCRYKFLSSWQEVYDNLPTALFASLFLTFASYLHYSNFIDYSDKKRRNGQKEYRK